MTIAHLAMEFNARGPSLNCLTACAASTQAIGEAVGNHPPRRCRRDDLRRGALDDPPLRRHRLQPPHRALHLQRQPAHRLPALRRHAAAASCWAKAPASSSSNRSNTPRRARGHRSSAEIVGYGSSCDAYAVTDQHPEGRGAIVAINEALKDAGIVARATSTTSTPTAPAPRKTTPPKPWRSKPSSATTPATCPSVRIKSMMGHLIAAAGAVELITCVLAIRDSIIPPTANYANPDPECDLDYVPNMSRKATGGRRHVQQLRLRRPERHADREAVCGIGDVFFGIIT